MKCCSKCKVSLDEVSFRKDASKSDGLYPSCNDCHRKRMGSKNAPEPTYANCGYCSESFRCRPNQLRVLKGESLFCSREHFKFYQAENRNDAHAYSGYRKYILERDKHQCFLCRNRDVIHVHHIKTRGAGGTDDYKNLISLCPSCHSNKAHGMYSEQYRKTFFQYTDSFVAPDYWPKVLELSTKDHEKLKKAVAKKARDRYREIKGTEKAITYSLKQKENRAKRNAEYMKEMGMKYSTYIERFKRENNGLSPSQVAYRKQKEYLKKKQSLDSTNG